MAHLFLILLTFLAADESALKWKRLPDLPSGVFNAAATVATNGEDLIVSGGLNQAGVASGFVQTYRAKRGRWISHLLLDPPRCNHAQITLDERYVLVAAGQSGGVREGFKDIKSAQLIDLQEQETLPLPDLPRAAGGPTGHRLADGRAVVIGNKTCAIFDPASRTWVRFIDLRQSRKWHASALLADGRIIVAGGNGRNTLEVIDVDAGISQLLSVRLPHALDDLAVAPLADGRALILGGQRNDGTTVDDTWLLDLSDPRAATLTVSTPLGYKAGVADHAVAVHWPWIFSVGGESEQGGQDVELASGRIIDGRTMRIWSLPDATSVHDDAVALPWRQGVVVIGGFRYGNGPFGAMKIPTASRVVETLQLPAEAYQ